MSENDQRFNHEVTYMEEAIMGFIRFDDDIDLQSVRIKPEGPGRFIVGAVFIVKSPIAKSWDHAKQLMVPLILPSLEENTLLRCAEHAAQGVRAALFTRKVI
jgi:hypothetical protein